MELEQRVEELEHEVEVLRGEIRGTLLHIWEDLLEEPPSPSRWRRRAWVLALLNVLLALTLFANVRLYTTGAPLGVSASLASWMRGFWVTLAFIWLLLQMYPLALLLEQEEKRPREAAWRNGAKIFASNPGLTLAVTLMVLAVAVVSLLFPQLWFAIVAALLIVLCVNAVRLYRKWTQERG